MAAKKRGLGRRLDALLSGSSPTRLQEETVQADCRESQRILLDLMQRGKYQPHRDMGPQTLEELTQSIKAQGVMQPIVVWSITNDRHEIIAGKRHWRASQQTGLEEIPVLVRGVPDEVAIAVALIENIQREGLNPIEEAAALQRLQQKLQLTQQQVTEAVGRSRVVITNLLRLIGLSEETKTLPSHGNLEMDHARVLLGLPAERQMEKAQHVVAHGLTAHQTETLIRQWTCAPSKPVGPVKSNSDIACLEQHLAEHLGALVQIRYGQKGRGQLVIRYSSLNELQDVFARIR